MIHREQQRMQKTWECLTGHFTDDTSSWQGDPRAKTYLSAVRKTPARIHSCGLGQALAFLRSRGRDESKWAEADLSRLVLEILARETDPDLLTLLRSTQQDLGFLSLVTEEAMEVCGWLARYLVGAGVTDASLEGDSD